MENTNYYPPNPFVGNPKSAIWIIGLNPYKKDNENQEKLSEEDSKKYFVNFKKYYENNDKKKMGVYYPSLMNAIQIIKEKILKNEVAHTDIVKISSQRWKQLPDEELAKIDPNIKAIKKDIERFRPKILICNGKTVGDQIKRYFPPNPQSSINPFHKKLIRGKKKILCYSYIFKERGINMSIISSYPVRRWLDKNDKKKLGEEIERHMNIYNLI